MSIDTRRAHLVLWLQLFGLPLAMTVAGWSQEASFSILPPVPTINDAVRIEVTYESACFTGQGRSRLDGDRLSIEVFEGCVCLAVLPFPVTLSTTVPALRAGDYTIAATAVPDPGAPDCSFAPRPLGSGELRVRRTASHVRVEPPSPDTDDDVVLILRSSCPLRVDAPAIARQQILIKEVPSGILAPCTDQLTWEIRLPLGKLRPGRYVVVWSYDGGDGGASLLTTRLVNVRLASE
jgi:hypothetical protein